VVQGHDHPLLLTDSLQANQLSWIAGRPPAARFRCAAKVRYRQEDRPCTVTMLPDGACEALFDEPQRAVTPGQYVVFYVSDECLGGGVIESARLNHEVRQSLRATM